MPLVCPRPLKTSVTILANELIATSALGCFRCGTSRSGRSQIASPIGRGGTGSAGPPVAADPGGTGASDTEGLCRGRHHARRHRRPGRTGRRAGGTGAPGAGAGPQLQRRHPGRGAPVPGRLRSGGRRGGERPGRRRGSHVGHRAAEEHERWADRGLAIAEGRRPARHQDARRAAEQPRLDPGGHGRWLNALELSSGRGRAPGSRGAVGLHVARWTRARALRRSVATIEALAELRQLAADTRGGGGQLRAEEMVEKRKATSDDQRRESGRARRLGPDRRARPFHRFRRPERVSPGHGQVPTRRARAGRGSDLGHHV